MSSTAVDEFLKNTDTGIFGLTLDNLTECELIAQDNAHNN
jgi:hypothetical protein